MKHVTRYPVFFESEALRKVKKTFCFSETRYKNTSSFLQTILVFYYPWIPPTIDRENAENGDVFGHRNAEVRRLPIWA